MSVCTGHQWQSCLQDTEDRLLDCWVVWVVISDRRHVEMKEREERAERGVR